MKTYPTIPSVSDAPPALLDGGHLWLLELVDGEHLRFQLQASGRLRFGDRYRTYARDEDLPERYAHAVSHVRERLDREALAASVPDVEEVVFYGEAMHRRTIAYDWERTPSFLGFAVWSGGPGRFLPPDAVVQIFERLGLDPINAFARELPARDFDADTYQIPASAWYDGPAAGVVIRDKTGGRAVLRHPQFEREGADPVETAYSATELVREYATERRFQTVTERLEARGKPVSFETVREGAIEDIRREANHVFERGPARLDTATFREEVARLTGRYLADRDGDNR